MTKRERLHPVIVQMRADGKLLREIGAELGLSAKTICEYLNDPAGEKDRARKAKRSRPCADCGKPVTNAGSEPPERCRPCRKTFEMSDMDYRRQASVRAAGRNVRWSDNDIFDALRASATTGRLTATQYDAVVAANPGRFPTRAAIHFRFGRWNDALAAAGLATVEPLAKGWGIGHAGALLAVQDCAHDLDLGRLPTSTEYDAWAKRTGAPSLGGIRLVYGSWQAAVEACDREMAREAVAA